MPTGDRAAIVGLGGSDVETTIHFLPITVTPMTRAPIVDQPEAGTYKGRFCRGGPMVAVKIVEGSEPEPMMAIINDTIVVDIWRAWLSVAGNPIDQTEYNRLIHLTRQWSAPQNTPFAPVDTAKIPLIRPTR